MDFSERKSLRLSLLKEAYDYYFSTQGDSLKLEAELLRKHEPEKLLAYNYLKDKGLVDIVPDTASASDCMITCKGIDFIENNESL